MRLLAWNFPKAPGHIWLWALYSKKKLKNKVVTTLLIIIYTPVSPLCTDFLWSQNSHIGGKKKKEDHLHLRICWIRSSGEYLLYFPIWMHGFLSQRQPGSVYLNVSPIVSVSFAVKPNFLLSSFTSIKRCLYFSRDMNYATTVTINVILHVAFSVHHCTLSE